MASVTSNGATPRIPAWQRLGLKLKAQPQAGAEIPAENDSPKRKRGELPEESLLASKRARTTDLQVPTNKTLTTPQLTRRKSVAFTPETKTEDGDSVKQLFNTWVCEQKEEHPDFKFGSTPAFDIPQPTKVIESIDITLNEKERRVKRVQIPEEGKVKKTKAKKAKLISPAGTQSSKPNSAPFLAYLKTYHEDRTNWKFNKAHQNHLLKHIFDVQVIPSEYVHQVYAYVRGLQGGVRTRLRDEALAIKVKDLEVDNMEGFSGQEDHATREKREYDQACADYVANMTVLDASSKMGYEEGVLAGLSDFGMAKRMAKRARAEMILAEFGNEPATKVNKVDEEDDKEALKRARLNDGSAQKVARKRKQRTRSLLQDSSSDGTTSDSDSESSTSGSSSDADSDDSDSSGSGSDSSSSGSKVTAGFPKPVISISDNNSAPDSDSDSSSSSSSSSSSGSEVATQRAKRVITVSNSTATPASDSSSSSSSSDNSDSDSD